MQHRHNKPPGLIAMTGMAKRLAQIFEAHRAPDRQLQEADRALQRGWGCVAIGAVWLFQFLTGQPVHAAGWFIVAVAILLPSTSYVYRRYALTRGSAALLVYV